MTANGELTALTLAGARDLLAARDVSSRELTEAHIAAMEAVRPLNAYITETPDRALQMAAAQHLPHSGQFSWHPARQK